MRKKYELNEEEKELFRSAMRGAKPYVYNKITPARSPDKKQPVREKEEPNPLKLFEDDRTEEVSGDQLIEFHRGGLQHKVLRKLRQGQYNVEAILDLHRMTVNEAREAVNQFLLRCIEKQTRHVLIIHGKGHGRENPILKNRLNQWLRQIEFVLAFCSATPQQGSSGAVYVLLKNMT